MTKEQKAVLQSQLNREKRTLNELKQVYRQALMDCEKKIMELSARTDLENLQSIIYQTRYQEAIRQQLEGILTALQSDSYSTVSDYLSRCYQDGYIGVMYDLHGQDIPLIMPIDQKAVVRAIQTDSKISKGLYNRLGEDVGKLKTSIRAEVSRGIAAGFTWNEVATKLAKSFKTTEFSKAYNNAMRIVRTEGHRIQVQSAMDAQQVAKDHGADIVKQWDATLDDRTRETHRMLDGQIRELDEPFEVGGMQADAPGMFGIASQDCNCRCALLQRARWELDEDELNTLKERAEFFGLDKTKDFEEFKEKYLEAASAIEKGSYLETVKRIGTNAVDLDYIKSEDFRKKFNQITDNSAVNDALRKYATAMLTHRNGTDGEDLYIIDAQGNLVIRKISGKNELGVKISEDESSMLRMNYPNGAIGIHNHPTNILPTGSDFAAAGYRKYKFGVVATHTGKVYKYAAGNKPFLPRMLDDRIDKYTKSPYNLNVEKAHIRALNEMVKEYGIVWQELE